LHSRVPVPRSHVRSTHGPIESRSSLLSCSRGASRLQRGTSPPVVSATSAPPLRAASAPGSVLPLLAATRSSLGHATARSHVRPRCKGNRRDPPSSSRSWRTHLRRCGPNGACCAGDTSVLVAGPGGTRTRRCRPCKNSGGCRGGPWGVEHACVRGLRTGVGAAGATRARSARRCHSKATRHARRPTLGMRGVRALALGCNHRVRQSSPMARSGAGRNEGGTARDSTFCGSPPRRPSPLPDHTARRPAAPATCARLANGRWRAAGLEQRGSARWMGRRAAARIPQAVRASSTSRVILGGTTGCHVAAGASRGVLGRRRQP